MCPVFIYLDIDNPYLKGMVNQVYPPELQLNKAIALKPSVLIYIFFQMFCFSSKLRIYCDDCDFDLRMMTITSLRERLRTHKVFTVDQIVVVFFYLKYHQFSLKSYVLDVY